MTIELRAWMLRDASAYLRACVPADFDNLGEEAYSCHAVGKFAQRELGLDFNEFADAYGDLLVEVGAIQKNDYVLWFGAVSHATQQEIRYMLMLFLAHYLEDTLQ